MENKGHGEAKGNGIVESKTASGGKKEIEAEATSLLNSNSARSHSTENGGVTSKANPKVAEEKNTAPTSTPPPQSSVVITSSQIANAARSKETAALAANDGIVQVSSVRPCSGGSGETNVVAQGNMGNTEDIMNSFCNSKSMESHSEKNLPPKAAVPKAKASSTATSAAVSKGYNNLHRVPEEDKKSVHADSSSSGSDDSEFPPKKKDKPASQINTGMGKPEEDPTKMFKPKSRKARDGKKDASPTRGKGGKDGKNGKGRKAKGRTGPFVFASSTIYNSSKGTTSATTSSDDDDRSRSQSRSRSHAASSCHVSKSHGINLSTGIGNSKVNSTTAFTSGKTQKEEEHDKKSSTDENNRWWRLTLRQKAWVIFLILEAFLIQNIFFIIAKYQYSVYTIMVETTKKELALMDTTYSTKVEQMSYGFQGQTKNGAMNDILKLYNAGGDITNHTDFAKVRSVLVGEVTQRQIEYATLVSLDRTILLNANDDRRGEVFDPEGLVSASIEYPEVGQLTTSTLVSYEELKHENPPLFRERQNVLQPTALNHPFDTEEQALIRYTTTPIFDLDDGETLLGILVSGDIVDGKVPITYDTVSVFEGGIASVFGHDQTFKLAANASDRVKAKGGKYWTASTMMAYDLAWTGIFDITNTQSLVDGIGYSATANFIPESLLDESLRRSKTADQITTADTDEFIFAVKPIPMGSYWDLVSSQGSTAEQIPVGFLVRGATMGPDEKGEILTSSFGMVLIFCGTMIALFDAVCIFGSIFLFIAPLEKLAQRVLRKKKIRSHHAKSIQRKAYLIAVIIMIAMCSIWPSVYFYYTFTGGMQEALERKSQQELGVGTVMYALKIDQMGFEFSGVAKNGAIRDLLDNPDDVEYQRLTQDALLAEVKARKIEYATLVNNKMKVVWSPNNNGMKVINGTWQPTADKGVIGEEFNPFGLTNLVLETGNRYQVTELLEWAILQGENAPVQKEKLDRTIKNSKLHPSKTEDLALIRYSATPVYASSTTASSSIDSDGRLQNVLPDGVLIAADIVNGKTIINERIIEVLETGYAAVYAYNDKCEQFFLVSSVYNPNVKETTSKNDDGNRETDNQVDVALSEGLARSLLRPVLRRGGKNTAWGKLPNGVTYAFSAKLVAPNERISPTAGSTAYPLSANFAYIVYGSPVKEMEGLIKEQEIWLGTLIALQCVKVFVIAGLCFVAYLPLFKILGTMKVYSINSAPGAAGKEGKA